jgi:hypothetical protein
MAVLIEDMELPKGCFLDNKPWRCDFNTGTFCKRTFRNVPNETNIREEKCPLKSMDNDTLNKITAQTYKAAYNCGLVEGLEQARKKTFKELYEQLVEEIRTTEREKIIDEIKNFYTVDDYPLNDEK